MDADSDAEEDELFDDGDSIQPCVNFVDVAKRSSAIRCNSHPNSMLNANITFGHDDKRRNTTLLAKAIVDDDYEAFVRIGSIYRLMNLPFDSPGITILDVVVREDRVEMLDQLIRLTGAGIDVKSVPAPADLPPPTGYLGLSIHGQKRIDLVKRDEPKPGEVFYVPLVWRACRAGAEKVVEYLTGERPLAAYRAFAAENEKGKDGNEIAGRLKYTPNWGEVLPEWLGWKVSSVGESPVTAAILGNQLAVLKNLFDLMPALAAEGLGQKYVRFLVCFFFALLNGFEQNQIPWV